jgi:uncharacterized protein
VATGHINTRIFISYFDDAFPRHCRYWPSEHIPNLSGVSMLLDLLDTTLDLPLKSKVVTQPYLDFLTHQYQLSHNGVHGIEHWLRVLINGRLITEQSGADIEVVEHFALIHDVQRQDEYRDIQHGNRAADLAASLMGDWIHLNSTQMYQLTEACRYHSMGRLSKDVTIQTCWDADRLDLGRVGERPNPTYLGTKAARDPEFIKAALLRSKNRFVNYQFAK